MIFNCGDLLELLGPVRGNLGRVVVSRAFRVVRGLALGNSKRSGPTRMLLGNFNPARNRNPVPARELFRGQTNSNFCFILGAVRDHLAHSFHPHPPLAASLHNQSAGDDFGSGNLNLKLGDAVRRQRRSHPRTGQNQKEQGGFDLLHTQGLCQYSNQKQELIWRFETRPVFPLCQYCFSSGPIME